MWKREAGPPWNSDVEDRGILGFRGGKDPAVASTSNEP